MDGLTIKMGGLTKPLFLDKLRAYKRLTNYHLVSHSVLSFAPSISHGHNGQGPDAMLTSVFKRMQFHTKIFIR